MMLTDERVMEITERLEKVQGPWMVRPADRTRVVNRNYDLVAISDEANADFIGNSWQDISDLLKERKEIVREIGKRLIQVFDDREPTWGAWDEQRNLVRRLILEDSDAKTK